MDWKVRRFVRRPIGRGVLAVTGALLVLAGGIAVGWRIPPTDAQGNAYRWWVRDDEPPDVDLIVEPVDRDDWAPYIEASNARLDGWLADPGGAPSLEGTYVTVTFRRPVSVTRFNAILAPLAGRVAQHTAVGTDDGGNRVEEVTFGPPDEAWLEGPNYDPGGDYGFALDGVIEADLWIGAERGVTPADLDRVRDDPEVHLVDTTAIQVLAVDLPAHGGAATVTGVVMDSPWHTLTW